jgi:hypothetical protein
VLILNSASDVDAEHNRQILHDTICDRLAKDKDMESRLQQVEQHLRLHSVASCRDDSSIRSDGSDVLTIRPSNSAAPSLDASSSSSDLPVREFEALLNSSWVYRRNEHRDETMSFRSSVIRMSAWSALSDLSLANISIIAVMALPVQLQELTNGHWYTQATISNASQPPKVEVPVTKDMTTTAFLFNLPQIHESSEESFMADALLHLDEATVEALMASDTKFAAWNEKSTAESSKTPRATKRISRDSRDLTDLFWEDSLEWKAPGERDPVRGSYLENVTFDRVDTVDRDPVRGIFLETVSSDRVDAHADHADLEAEILRHCNVCKQVRQPLYYNGVRLD